MDGALMIAKLAILSVLVVQWVAIFAWALGYGQGLWK